MPTNQEWLHKLASESPDELKAWFEAEHVYDMDNAECVHMCPNEANDENQRESGVRGDAAHSNDANAHLKASEDLSDGFTDIRENLEVDASMLANIFTDSYSDHSELFGKIIELLDRQAAITKQQTERKWCCYEGSVQAEIDRLQRRNDELRTSYDKLKRERDNLADDLLTCNREREQLREHLGIALDHAHDICALVDIGD